jgi:hypothetical protein
LLIRKLIPEQRLKRWERTVTGWRSLPTEFGGGKGLQDRHPLDWLAWDLGELVEAAEELDLSVDQCLSVEVNLPQRGDEVDAAEALQRLRWDRSFGFWSAPGNRLRLPVQSVNPA